MFRVIDENVTKINTTENVKVIMDEDSKENLYNHEYSFISFFIN